MARAPETPARKALAAHFAALVAAVGGPQAVGDRTGYSRQQIHQWCTGRTYPRPDAWDDLADALGLDDYRGLFPAAPRLASTAPRK